MSELTVKELISKYPHLKEMEEKFLFVDRDVFRFYLNDKKVAASECLVSVTLLEKLITDLEYYSYVEKLFNGEIDRIKIAYITYGDISTTINLNKAELVSGLDILINSQRLLLDSEAFKRYQLISKDVSFKSYLEKISGTFYEIEIDGNHYSISIEDIISFMQIDKIKFDEICENDEIKELYGLKKEHFVYACYRYFSNPSLFSNYAFPRVIIDRFNELDTYEKIDFQAINKITTTDDPNLDKIIVNDELRNAILEEMPHFDELDYELVNVGKLIQAIYIYIKMCKILTYDEEFYAVNQKGVVAKKHEDIGHVASITPQNNKVVCYEFNAIYGKLLDEIGIKFQTIQALVDSFGGGHAYLTFRWDKFLVEADSVDSILKSDMMNAKLNQLLSGLVCKNKNIKTRDEFDEIVSRVYSFMVSKEQNKDESMIDIYHVETFDEILAQYRRRTTNISPVSIDDKFRILIRKVNDARMKEMDSLSYAIQLEKILFTKIQRKDNIALRIIRNNDTGDDKKIATVNLIFVLNQYSFTYNPDGNSYYLYSPGKKISIINRDSLLQMFNDGTLCFIENTIDDIPGLIRKGGISK